MEQLLPVEQNNMARSLDGCTILVVDDNVDHLHLVSAILSRYKANLLLASEPDAGFDLLRLNPHIVLLDITMPGMSGIEFAKKARKSGYSGIIVAVTGRAMAHELEEVIRSGCNSYITKPYEINSFIKSITDTLYKIKKPCS